MNCQLLKMIIGSFRHVWRINTGLSWNSTIYVQWNRLEISKASDILLLPTSNLNSTDEVHMISNFLKRTKLKSKKIANIFFQVVSTSFAILSVDWAAFKKYVTFLLEPINTLESSQHPMSDFLLERNSF